MQENYACSDKCYYCKEKIINNEFIFIQNGKSHLKCVPDNIFINYLLKRLDNAKYNDYIKHSSSYVKNYFYNLKEKNFKIKNKIIDKFLSEHNYL